MLETRAVGMRADGPDGIVYSGSQLIQGVLQTSTGK